MLNQIIGSGERRSTAPVTSRIKLITDPDERDIRHSVIDDVAIFEGDIILSSPLEPQGVVISGVGSRWPNRTVVFEIDAALTQPERVIKAIEHWERETKIRFKPRTTERDFVIFKAGGGCASRVGKVGGVQFVTLGPSCEVGNVIHEIGHTVGLWHEQSREDRDRFVTIMFDNIPLELQHNFDQHISDGDDIGGYDTDSIMHYPSNAFAIEPTKPTIVVRNGARIGQREALSPGDKAAVDAIYP